MKVSIINQSLIPDEFVTMFGLIILVFVAYHGIRLETATHMDIKTHAKKGFIVSSLLFVFYLGWIAVYAPYSQSIFTEFSFILVDRINDIGDAISIGPQSDGPSTAFEQIVGTIQVIGLILWMLLFMLLSILKTPILIIGWFEKLLD